MPQSWNGYAYVMNIPMAYVDPSGLGPCPVREDGTEEPCLEELELSAWQRRFFEEMRRRSDASNQMITTVAVTSTTAGVFAGTGAVVAVIDGVGYTWQSLLALGPQALAKLVALGKISKELWAKIQPYIGGGLEINFGKGRLIERINLFGDWRRLPGHAMEWYQRLPHYHRRFPGPGGSIDRHRPWESPGIFKGKPLSWWKRF